MESVKDLIFFPFKMRDIMKSVVTKAKEVFKQEEARK